MEKNIKDNVYDLKQNNVKIFDSFKKNEKKSKHSVLYRFIIRVLVTQAESMVLRLSSFHPDSGPSIPPLMPPAAANLNSHSRYLPPFIWDTKCALR